MRGLVGDGKGKETAGRELTGLERPEHPEEGFRAPARTPPQASGTGRCHTPAFPGEGEDPGVTHWAPAVQLLGNEPG